ncbi:hypothetical protein KC853_02240, partial [Candidatus Saccharibacteria bacterium]|nr:hypothetical protein [Candidatus Saccharibacteria bacterium]
NTGIVQVFTPKNPIRYRLAKRYALTYYYLRGTSIPVFLEFNPNTGSTIISYRNLEDDTDGWISHKSLRDFEI